MRWGYEEFSKDIYTEPKRLGQRLEAASDLCFPSSFAQQDGVLGTAPARPGTAQGSYLHWLAIRRRLRGQRVGVADQGQSRRRLSLAGNSTP